MDIRFVESLVTIVETGSIAAAARRQNLTAAAVGQRIKSLEQELNVSLLQRHGHKATPTVACTRLLPRARRLMAEYAAIRNELNADGLVGEFRLGAISTALVQHIPQIVQLFDQLAPNADLKIIPGTSANLFQDLRAGILDAAILVEPNTSMPKQFVVNRIGEQPYALIGEQEREKPLIVYDRESWGGKIAWEWIEKHLPDKKILCELDSLETIISLVQRGMGFAVLPIIQELCAQVDPNQIEIISNEPITRRIGLVSPANYPFPAFLRIVEKAILQK